MFMYGLTVHNVGVKKNQGKLIKILYDTCILVRLEQ